MLGLTPGELIVVTFVTVAVITASWWPRAGAAVADMLSSSGDAKPAPPEAARTAPETGGGPASAPDADPAPPKGEAPFTGPGQRGP